MIVTYLALIQAAAARYDVPAALIAAIIHWESNFDPAVIGDQGHSVGLMQLHDQGAGAGWTVAQRLDPATNIDVGTACIRRCLDAFPGDLRWSIAAYNQGISATRVHTWRRVEGYVEGVEALYNRYLAEGLAEPSPSAERAEGEVETIGGHPVAFAMLKEYVRRGRSDGAPRGPAAYCGDDCLQSFASGAVYVWAGGKVHVLNDSV